MGERVNETFCNWWMNVTWLNAPQWCAWHTEKTNKQKNKNKKPPQFSWRKSTLATLFDVKKAYDNVWHARLLYKLKNVEIKGMMFQYIKNFLSERCICTRVGKTYSSIKNIDMGIPQGSVIAPILFSILIHDLPKAL